MNAHLSSGISRCLSLNKTALYFLVILKTFFFFVCLFVILFGFSNLGLIAELWNTDLVKSSSFVLCPWGVLLHQAEATASGCILLCTERKEGAFCSSVEVLVFALWKSYAIRQRPQHQAVFFFVLRGKQELSEAFANTCFLLTYLSHVPYSLPYVVTSG